MVASKVALYWFFIRPELVNAGTTIAICFYGTQRLVSYGSPGHSTAIGIHHPVRRCVGGMGCQTFSQRCLHHAARRYGARVPNVVQLCLVANPDREIHLRILVEHVCLRQSLFDDVEGGNVG